MPGTNLPALFCPEQGCRFTYTEDETNALKTHRVKEHVHQVKVCYTNPPEEIVLHRTGGGDHFQCLRCSFISLYPSVMQVSKVYTYKFY